MKSIDKIFRYFVYNNIHCLKYLHNDIYFQLEAKSKKLVYAKAKRFCIKISNILKNKR